MVPPKTEGNTFIINPITENRNAMIVTNSFLKNILVLVDDMIWYSFLSIITHQDSQLFKNRIIVNLNILTPPTLFLPSKKWVVFHDAIHFISDRFDDRVVFRILQHCINQFNNILHQWFFCPTVVIAGVQAKS